MSKIKKTKSKFFLTIKAPFESGFLHFNEKDSTMLNRLLMIVNDAFIVYSSEGQMFNPIPNSNAMMRSVTIEPGEQYRNSLIWPWGSVPLSPGRYYSKYTLNIGNINKTYTVNFEIK